MFSAFHAVSHLEDQEEDHELGRPTSHHSLNLNSQGDANTMTLLELMNTLWSSNMAMEHPLKIEASYGIIEKWWVFHYRRAYHIALNYTHTVLCYLILLYINFPIFEKLKLGLVQCYTQVGERERDSEPQPPFGPSVRSAIHELQQFTSPLGFLSLKLPLTALRGTTGIILSP